MEHLTWKKSSRSAPNGGDCVEVAVGSAYVHVRDSKDPGGPVLTMTKPTWAHFVNIMRDS